MSPSRIKDERMWEMATKLAHSGKYANFLQIEWELRAMGYSRARQLLDDDLIREKYNLICTEAKK